MKQYFFYLSVFLSFPVFSLEPAWFEGEYSRHHQLTMINSSPPEIFDVTDTLSIKGLGDNKFKIKVHTVHANGHSCNFKGTALYENERLLYKGSKKTIDEECILELHFYEENIILKDIGNSCRKIWCGARGGFNATRFSIK